MTRRVLLLYYSFTNQTRRVSAAMAGEFRDKGWDVRECPIELTDSRYQITFPFRPFFWMKLLRWFWPQVTGKTGDISVSQEVLEEDYDLICLGSPTWWLRPALPVVSFLKSESAGKLLSGRRFAVFTVCRKVWRPNMNKVKKLATQQGGTFVDGATFCFQGGEIQSALSFISYMKTETNRERYLGCRIYEFGIPEEGLENAREFARDLAGSEAAAEA